MKIGLLPQKDMNHLPIINFQGRGYLSFREGVLGGPNAHKLRLWPKNQRGRPHCRRIIGKSWWKGNPASLVFRFDGHMNGHVVATWQVLSTLTIKISIAKGHDSWSTSQKPKISQHGKMTCSPCQDFRRLDSIYIYYIIPVCILKYIIVYSYMYSSNKYLYMPPKTPMEPEEWIPRIRKVFLSIRG